MDTRHSERHTLMATRTAPHARRLGRRHSLAATMRLDGQAALAKSTRELHKGRYTREVHTGRYTRAHKSYARGGTRRGGSWRELKEKCVCARERAREREREREGGKEGGIGSSSCAGTSRAARRHWLAIRSATRIYGSRYTRPCRHEAFWSRDLVVTRLYGHETLWSRDFMVTRPCDHETYGHETLWSRDQGLGHETDLRLTTALGQRLEGLGPGHEYRRDIASLGRILGHVASLVTWHPWSRGILGHVASCQTSQPAPLGHVSSLHPLRHCVSRPSVTCWSRARHVPWRRIRAGRGPP
jgi:hypothetical protein